MTQLLTRFLYTYGQQPILQKSVAMHMSAGVRSSWLTLKSASLSPRFILYSLSVPRPLRNPVSFVCYLIIVTSGRFIDVLFDF